MQLEFLICQKQRFYTYIYPNEKTRPFGCAFALHSKSGHGMRNMAITSSYFHLVCKLGPKNSHFIDKQTLTYTITLSNTKIGYKLRVDRAKDIIWIKMLKKEFQILEKVSSLLLCDNQWNIQLVKNTIYHARTKHIEMSSHV